MENKIEFFVARLKGTNKYFRFMGEHTDETTGVVVHYFEPNFTESPQSGNHFLSEVEVDHFVRNNPGFEPVKVLQTTTLLTKSLKTNVCGVDCRHGDPTCTDYCIGRADRPATHLAY